MGFHYCARGKTGIPKFRARQARSLQRTGSGTLDYAVLPMSKVQ
jgi:hypothetical protein